MTDRPLFVTGASGFIGRRVVVRLLEDGHRLLLAETTSYPSQWRNDPRIQFIGLKRLEKEKNLAKLVGNSCGIVHLAGLAHVAKGDNDNPGQRFFQANALATANLVEAAMQLETNMFIHVSSLATIVPNSVDVVVSDVTKNEPVAAYGRSKREAEEHVAKLAERGVLAISLRPPLVVGADAKGNWAGLQKLAATGIPLPFGGIHNERSFIGVWSLAEMIAHLCRSDWHSELSGNYCVADPGFLSLPDIVTELRSGMGIPARLFSIPSVIFDWAGALSGRRRQFAGLTGNLRVDPSRFLTRFGFKPALPVREAIRHSGADYISGAKGGAR